jgi:hypothetical protein
MLCENTNKILEYTDICLSKLYNDSKQIKKKNKNNSKVEF